MKFINIRELSTGTSLLIQFRSQSLLQHLSDGWQFGGILKSEFLIPVPAQMRAEGKEWYRGTADAIHQNIRGCLGTHFRNSLKIGRLDKINPLF